MKVIIPTTVNDTTLTASNLAEDATHSAWSSGTTYAAGEYAYSVATHRVYRSVQGGNLNNDPTTDDGTWWVNYSATNKWKPFDYTISDAAVGSGTVEHEVELDGKIDHVAFFGVQAPEVTVEVYDLTAAKVWEETQTVADFSAFVDWYTFFTEEPGFETELLFYGIPGLAGYTVKTIVGDGTGNPSVGQIVIGKVWPLGLTLEGTEVGFKDFSIKDQDDFGNLSILERGYADTARFVFAFNKDQARAVKRTLISARATPCVYFADYDMLDTATFVFGYFDDFSIPLASAGYSTAILEVKGLI